MAMLAEHVDAVVGVDTHTETHSASLVNPLGAELAAITVTADPAGYARLLAWAVEDAPGPRLVWAIEGSRSHGVGLARTLIREGHRVVEADRPPRASRRPGGKSDPRDALRAARAVLAREQLLLPRADGAREAVRVLLVTRESAVAARTAAINQLKALVLTAPDALRERLRRLPRPALLQTCIRLRPDRQRDVDARGLMTALRRLARRLHALTSEIRDADRELLELTRQHVPQLLATPGIGPIAAAQALVSWSHPGRLPSEASFAALAGASPLEVSSGSVTRHRLNPFGDRALNRVLHTSVITLQRCDDRTKTYVARRRAEGKSDPEIRRCLKRYLARKIYRLLEHPPQTATIKHPTA